MEDFGQKVVEKIKGEKICPEPKWHFLLKDYFVWLAFAVSIIVGGLSFCTIIYIFFNNDWDIYKYLHTSVVGHIMLSMPFIWILFMILFTALAYYNYKHTKKGYRHEAYIILLASIAGSILLGSVLHVIGAGEKIEDAAVTAIPLYEKMTCCHNRKDIWSQPDKGLLGGRIMKIADQDDFNLEDFNGSVWVIQEDDQTLNQDPMMIREGEEVKIIGEKKEAQVFWAREIRPWRYKMLNWKIFSGE